MVRRRLLEPEYSGVYAVAYAPPVPLARETAALLACHGRAVLSHRSAAARPSVGAGGTSNSPKLTIVSGAAMGHSSLS